jgi:hypothetical protein
LALAGFLFILFSRPQAFHYLVWALAIAVLGTILYLLRARSRHEWPFRMGAPEPR